MRKFITFSLVLFGSAIAVEGYLSVLTDRPGLSIYLDSEFIGKSPLEKRPVLAGEHTVSLFHPDTIENAYWQVRQQGILRMITKLPDLRRYDVGTKRVVVDPNATVKVFLSYGQALRAPAQTSCLMTGCITGVVGGSFALGFILAWLLNR